MSELTRHFSREYPHLVARASEIIADELQHNPSPSLLNTLKDLNADAVKANASRLICAS